jgi:hypothetical protein
MHNTRGRQEKMASRGRKNFTARISAVIFSTIAIVALGRAKTSRQEFLPSPPPDHSLIYVLDQQNKLTALPYERAESPLHTNEIAKNTKSSYIELKGEHAATVFSPTQRIFVFVTDRGGAHTPMIVWLTPHRGARRVMVTTERGLAGFAVSSDQIVKPAVRGLNKNGDEVFMELRPRVSLMPGEYAIIGSELSRVATFRVTAAGSAP